jgi:hypothetical protein
MLLGCASRAQAQEDHSQHNMAPAGGWMLMFDGAAFATFNKQGGDRGQTEFKSQNWFMGMAEHKLGAGQITFKGMFSAEVLTQTARGYSQLFQHGEAYKGLENIDYQHPHDMFMQLAAAWRLPLGDRTGVTISGGPMGEATFGPSAFMHRQSASENPTAPLSHHFLDSTHIVAGVVALALDRGPLTLEGSVFHGRESDEDRYDIRPGRLDSWATRVLYRPSRAVMAQVSYTFMNEPEELERGDARKASASLSWSRGDETRYFAATAAVGHRRRIYDTNTTSTLLEATLHRARGAVYTRAEYLQVGTEHLLFPQILHTPHPGEIIDWVGALTAGGVFNFTTKGPLEIGLGADATFHKVPRRLQTSTQVTLYGANPVSFHVFLRIRPRAPSMGHMWNMIMSDAAMR